MADINLPGISSNIDVKGIIDKLVSLESRKLERFETAKEELDREKSAWITLNTKVKNLETAASALYGFRSPFEDKIARSGDESVFTAHATRVAEPFTSSVKVSQVARSERIASDSVDSNTVLGSTLLNIRVGEADVTVDFAGGSLEKLAEAINKQAGDYLRAKVTRDTENTSVLVIETKKTGEKNRIQVSDPDSVTLFRKLGLIEERPEFSVDTRLSGEKIVPRAETAPTGYKVTDDVLTLDPRSSVELPISRSVGGKPELVLRAKIRAVDLLGEAEAKPAPTWPELNAIGKVTVRDVDVEGGKPVSRLEVAERREVEPEVVDNAVIGLGGAGDLARMTEAAGLTETFKEYSFRLSELLGEGERADRILFENKNTGRRIEFRDVVIEDSRGGGGIAPKHPVQEAQDAIVFIDGVKVQRAENQIDDAVKGVGIELRSAIGKEVPLTVERDYETITKRIVDLVEKYNDLMKFMNEQTRVVSSGRLTEKNEVGTLTGDITVMGLKNRLQNIMMNPYPTERGRELSLLAQIGISMGNVGSNWSDIRGGELQVDENKFVAAFEKFPDSIRQLFGSDNDGDMVIENGVAFLLEKNLKAYSEPRNGIIANRVRTTDNGIKRQDDQIGDWKEHLDEYRRKLERDFTFMQQSLNELEQNQKRLQNFSNQFGNRE